MSALFREMGWDIATGKDGKGSVRLPDRTIPVAIREVPAPGGEPLNLYFFFQPPEEAIDTESLQLVPSLGSFEKRIIQAALQTSAGNISNAAQLLDIPRQTLQYKLGKLNIAAEKYCAQ